MTATYSYTATMQQTHKTTFEKAAERFLKENPRFAGGTNSYRISTSAGNTSEGSGGDISASINDRIRAAARR